MRMGFSCLPVAGCMVATAVGFQRGRHGGFQLPEDARPARHGDHARLAAGVGSLGEPGVGFAAERSG